MFLILVGLARPEKAFQPILLAAGNNVNVKVGNALTDTIINSDKGAFDQQALLYRASQKLDIGK